MIIYPQEPNTKIVYQEHQWSPHGAGAQVHFGKLDERVQEMVSNIAGSLSDWRPRDQEHFHPRGHDARRLGRLRHLLRDDSQGEERVQEVQLEVHGH